MGNEQIVNTSIKGKRIVLGVTGSIAAYKAIELASKLTQQGALVDTILTESAQKFVAPLSFQSVTGRKAYTENDLWGSEGHVTHISLGHAAELLLIAPASANTIARLANGIGDNLLCVTALASQCPLMIAPAMDAGMFDHLATKDNVEKLIQRGATFIGPESGHLASGKKGLGRFVDPAVLIEHIKLQFAKEGPLKSKQIVVTAGRTQEPIDPVRVLTNRSSGKQGYAVAQAALDAGANVTLITGPTSISPPIGAALVQVETTQEMLEAVLNASKNANALIMCAAPADFRPKNIADNKIKKEARQITTIEIEANPDILLAVKKQKQEIGFPQFTVGFAAESQDLLKNANYKLSSKKLDMIVANDISLPNAGFQVPTNQVTFIFPDGKAQTLPLLEKTEVAKQIIQQVCKWM